MINPTPSSQNEPKKEEPVISHNSHYTIPVQSTPEPQKSKKIEPKRNSGFSR